MKKLAAVVLCFFAFTALFAQGGQQLIIEGDGGKFYVKHTVAAKENWYSVGRIYNISPKEIAPFNNLTLDQPLNIGQQLKIPLTSTNFSQTGAKASGETLVPLYHVIREREWMYHISTVYNKVPVDRLEKWNGIKKEQAKTGMSLIVGFLKVKTALSALANGGTSPAVTTMVNAPVQQHEEKTAPAVEQQKKPEPVTTIASAPPAAAPSPSGGAGFFASEYHETGKTASGFSGVFKSTSGWQDGRYYALMNSVPVGTIIKVTNAANGKSVYAKVLGQLPDMKESIGLTLRISNAAAAELGTTSEKFTATINY